MERPMPPHDHEEALEIVMTWFAVVLFFVIMFLCIGVAVYAFC